MLAIACQLAFAYNVLFEVIVGYCIVFFLIVVMLVIRGGINQAQLVRSMLWDQHDTAMSAIYRLTRVVTQTIGNKRGTIRRSPVTVAEHTNSVVYSALKNMGKKAGRGLKSTGARKKQTVRSMPYCVGKPVKSNIKAETNDVAYTPMRDNVLTMASGCDFRPMPCSTQVSRRNSISYPAGPEAGIAGATALCSW